MKKMIYLIFAAALCLMFWGSIYNKGHAFSPVYVKTWSMKDLPDTGQTQDFTSTFGEDSDYTINPPSFTDNKDGTITDNITGLMWQQVDGGEMTWDKATSHPLTLTLGGFKDWRLPTAHELYSIMNLATVNPALNTTYFTSTSAEYWWSRDTLASDSSRVWVTNAGGGIGPHPKTETISAGGTRRIHVRCVRGADAPSVVGPIHHLNDNGNGTVTDSDTGLMWQKGEADSTMNWENALIYAEGLDLAGYNDWRLPNIKEIESINDESMTGPSIDIKYFPGAVSASYWSSTSMFNDIAKAWTNNFQFGIVSYSDKTTQLSVRCVRTLNGSAASAFSPEFAYIPAGSFEMGDHHSFVDPDHPSDEIPIHTLSIDSFYMQKTTVTCSEYCAFLNSAMAQGLIQIKNNFVYDAAGTNIYGDTYASDTASRIQYASNVFSVRDNKELHPITGVRWFGAIAYCNWLSTQKGYESCYNLTTGICDFTKKGYRLPTEAEWEYAARGGQYSPYRMFPWGDDMNTSGTLTNWPNSGDPYESGANPWTTPVGFYKGQLHQKSDFGWPGSQTSYQTRDNSNGFGLYDMSGNIWQWTNDWYGKDYYQYCVNNNIIANPQGPATGDPMPDGNPYRVLRGGNWFNGEQYYGHGRVANRNPGYYRGPGDPNGPWFHVGFRPIIKSLSVVESGVTIQLAGSGYLFTEGPATNAAGDIYFSDIDGNKIYKWTEGASITTFKTGLGGPNGSYFDAAGNLIVCEGANKRLISIDMSGNITALASQYNSATFNKPNDLWIAPNGGIYFTDGLFGTGTFTQDGECVYYLSPDRSTVTRVISDMIRPNGVIGTPDGKILYAADYGAGKVYKYTINSDGTLSGKTLFASVVCDGMTIDSEGNIYMAKNAVLVYNSAGTFLEQITIPEKPTNMTFGGKDEHTLFITARTTIYTIKMRVSGAEASSSDSAPIISGTSISPSQPTSSDAVWVTSTVTDDGSVASVNLRYSTGTAKKSIGKNITKTETTVFQETMCTTAAKPWTGSGAEHSWTVTGSQYVEQRTGANYGTGNPCGAEFHIGTTNLTGTMIETTNAINAAGTSGYVEFWLQAIGVDGTDGWTFQIDAGSGYQTRSSELSGSNHTWQQYHYDLQSSELVSGIKLRFQFCGGNADERVNLDQIIIKVTSGGSSSVTVSMYDDGGHSDGNSGDGIYGAQIPAFPAGTTLTYYITALDNTSNQTQDPINAPIQTYIYTVSVPSSTKTIGLFLNDPRAYNGYTLFAPKHNTMTYLINNEGRVVHSWTASTYEPGQSVYLLENGHLLRACFTQGALTGGGEGGRIEEYDWDDNLVWELDYSTSTYMSHHDIKHLPNGNVIMLVVEKKTYSEVIAAGFNPALLHSDISSKNAMYPDSVIEIQPTGSKGGTVVWEWHVWDHLIQDFDPTKNNYAVVANYPGLIDVNGYVESGAKIMQFWNHANSIDYNADLDQIVISARGSSEIWVIDHSITSAEAAGHTAGKYGKGGDLLYRWGNPVTYDAGSSGDQMLFDQHDAQWIEDECPGAGNMLIFNNGLGRNYSSVDEIATPVNADGSYSLTAGLAYSPKSLTWTYVATPPSSMYSEAISGAQRLPNGNTLICDGVHGIFLEVTSEGETVWHYVNPVTKTGPLIQGETPPLDDRGHQYNAVFKIHRYPPEYPAFTGKDLTPGDPIEKYLISAGWQIY